MFNDTMPLVSSDTMQFMHSVVSSAQRQFPKLPKNKVYEVVMQELLETLIAFEQIDSASLFAEDFELIAKRVRINIFAKLEII